MCRTSGACQLYTPGTQRSRAGLATDAPPALAGAAGIRAIPYGARREAGPSYGGPFDCAQDKPFDSAQDLPGGRLT